MECFNPDSPQAAGAATGGVIPGLPGQPGHVFSGPKPSAIPVLIAVPHAGRAYPPELLERLRDPEAAMLRLEDRHVDSVATALARATGANLLCAHAPRALIDLNRAPDDIDPAMLPRAERPTASDWRSGHRARSGLGLFPRRVPGIGELWKGRLGEGEASARIAGVHAPYHAALNAALADLNARWGAALLIDLHSMPPLPAPSPDLPIHFVVGDRFGASCHGQVVAEMFDCFGRGQRGAAHNRPYAGGYVLERHGAPQRGIHAVQLEIDRSIYLDSALREPGEGMAILVDLLADMVRRLAALVAAMTVDDATANRRFAAE